ncbi:MAG: hypothetical protein JWP57_3340 [Spirosoma sp.]|nr:hypothetical protein [Spirosoma sp.]
MRTGLVHSYSIRVPVYYKIKRQIVAEYKEELEQATGWKKVWVRWKRSIALEIRYNNLLFVNRDVSITGLATGV